MHPPPNMQALRANSLIPGIRTSVGLLIVGMILSAFYLHFFVFRAYMEIEMQAFSDQTTSFKVYWSDENGFFSEDNSKRRSINPTISELGFFLVNLRNVKELRIDPIEYPGQAKITRIYISQFGFEPVELKSEKDFQKLKVLQQIERVKYKSDGLQFETTGNDNQFLLELDLTKNSIFPIQHIVNIALIFGLLFFLQMALNPLRRNLVFVPACLLIALVLALIMASITPFNLHPDEKVHLAAVDYYSKHFLPPSLDAPDLAHTFSDYGRSRLDTFEVYYQVAGYFTRLLSPFKLSIVLNARLFGILMLLTLALLAARKTEYRSFVLPLLITPQAWYLFSYVNSDGFALFLSIVMSYQVAVKDSLLNRFLIEPSPSRFGITAISLGLLSGSLLLLKHNYYFFVLFLGIYLLWRIFMGDFPDQKQFWTRTVLLVIIGLSLYGARYGWDVMVNGPDSQVTRERLAEKYAKHLYKPSTPLEEKHIYLYLKDRGFSLDRLIHAEKWGIKTFGSGFGIYGYTQYFASKTFYNIVAILAGLLLLTMLFSVLIKGPPSMHALFLVTGACSMLVILATFLIAWLVAFQAQGRYLAPILPMFGILYYHVRPYLFSRLFHLIVVAMFCFSFYSFIFVGLRQVPKLSYILGY